MAVHRPRRDGPQFVVIVDHEYGRFTVEGPVGDFLPWVRAVEGARSAGRQVDFSIVSHRRSKPIFDWANEIGYELWPPGTIIDPGLKAADSRPLR